MPDGYTRSSVHRLNAKSYRICFYTGHESRRRRISALIPNKQEAHPTCNDIPKIEYKPPADQWVTGKRLMIGKSPTSWKPNSFSPPGCLTLTCSRSEERRVGKEC